MNRLRRFVCVHTKVTCASPVSTPFLEDFARCLRLRSSRTSLVVCIRRSATTSLAIDLRRRHLFREFKGTKRKTFTTFCLKEFCHTGLARPPCLEIYRQHSKLCQYLHIIFCQKLKIGKLTFSHFGHFLISSCCGILMVLVRWVTYFA